MKIKAVICDIDGTLLESDSGTIVKDSVANALIALQQKGMLLILASARIFQGVYPLAKQLQMDRYGGYIVSCNGSHVFDVKRKEKIFAYEMKCKDVLTIWDVCKQMHIDFAISQPAYMVASAFSRGFSLDHANCDVDYLITRHPEALLKKEITKCSVSGEEEDIDRVFLDLKRQIEEHYPYQVVRSTPYVLDIVSAQAGKASALSKLFDMISLNFDDVAAIGDGDSDAEMLRRSGCKATLANGSIRCKQYADMIVDDCRNDGCLQFFEKLMRDVDK